MSVSGGEADGRGAAAIAWLTRVGRSAWFAYVSIFLIELKTLWGAFEYRDLAPADTPVHYVHAHDWTHGLDLDLVLYPLFSFYWGSLQWFVTDLYTAAILQRVLVALALALLVLAVLRRLLTPGIAWALALWFAVNPINYDTLVDLHLFAAIPTLAAVLVALTWSGPGMRAAVFGVLLGTTVLVRQETVFAVLAWLVAWGGYELWLWRRGEPSDSPARLARLAAVPVLVVIALTGAVLALSPQRGEVKSTLDYKHELNVCQVYAFGYQQRYDDYTSNPFTECKPLLQRDFDDDSPSLLGAMRANPSAMLEHFAWNARLTPYGLQLMLFDRTSGSTGWNPDYGTIKSGSRLALMGSVAVVVLMLIGGVLLWRDRRRWWEEWIRDRVWGWVALGAIAVTAVAVIISQRPRPSYLFALEVLLLAVIGLCAMAVVDRWRWLGRLAAVVPIAAVAFLLFVPSHYRSGYQSPELGPGRPLKEMVERLEPFEDRFSTETRMLAGTPEFTGCLYVSAEFECLPLESAASSPGGVPALVDEQRIDYIYADRDAAANEAVRASFTALQSRGWRRLAPAGGESSWLFLGRVTPSGDASQ